MLNPGAHLWGPFSPGSFPVGRNRDVTSHLEPTVRHPIAWVSGFGPAVGHGSLPARLPLDTLHTTASLGFSSRRTQTRTRTRTVPGVGLPGPCIAHTVPSCRPLIPACRPLRQGGYASRDLTEATPEIGEHSSPTCWGVAHTLHHLQVCCEPKRANAPCLRCRPHHPIRPILLGERPEGPTVRLDDRSTNPGPGCWLENRNEKSDQQWHSMSPSTAQPSASLCSGKKGVLRAGPDPVP